MFGTLRGWMSVVTITVSGFDELIAKSTCASRFMEIPLSTNLKLEGLCL